jgi:hypothetical protein
MCGIVCLLGVCLFDLVFALHNSVAASTHQPNTSPQLVQLQFKTPRLQDKTDKDNAEGKEEVKEVG